MNKISSLLWGLVFIIVGVIFGLNALDITNINVFFDGWWTLFIIIPCFIEYDLNPVSLLRPEPLCGTIRNKNSSRRKDGFS